MDKPACTIVHISDLHFGAQFIIDGESTWRKAIARAPFLHHVTGYFPHSYQTANALAIAVRRILKERRDRGVPAVVVHTGDLTASGSRAEFSVGDTFLRHGHYLENGTLAGLSLETDFRQQAFDLPGNHDLWHRRSPKDHSAFTSHYGGTYPRTRAIPTSSKLVLLYGLDSSRSSLIAHRLANGEIEASSLATVCEALKSQKGPNTIQIVCLHHPLRLRRRTAPRMFGMEVLKLRDRERICRELFEAGAQMVLGGHVHQQVHSNSPLTFVAGSGCQISSRPGFWQLDLFDGEVGYTYHHLPRHQLHFDTAVTRSGSAAYS